MEALECIKTRRSVRHYSDKPIDREMINIILEAAISAPSGKNGQPWKFKVIVDKCFINQLSDLSIYGSWMKTAASFIVVFLDKSCSYNYLKDVQSCGAVMQNIMLAAHSINIGSCWIGEILQKANEVKDVLHIENKDLELMGIVTLGYQLGEMVNSRRKNIESFLL